MILDDVVTTSYKCLRALRDAERQWKEFPENGMQRLEEATAYLNILRKESPLMYSILHPEYDKALKMYEDNIWVE